MQEQASSALTFLQCTQQRICVVKRYFFIKMKQNTLVLAASQSREKFPTVLGSGTCFWCGFCLFTEEELCVRFFSSSVPVHAGV